MRILANDSSYRVFTAKHLNPVTLWEYENMLKDSQPAIPILPLLCLSSSPICRLLVMALYSRLVVGFVVAVLCTSVSSLPCGLCENSQIPCSHTDKYQLLEHTLIRPQR